MPYIKKLLRRFFPAIYTRLYQFYFRHIRPNKKLDAQRLVGYSRFVKAGFYPFLYKDIHFDLFLDPENGGVDFDIFVDKRYEAQTLDVIAAHLQKGDVFVDVGANIGQHALYAAYLCNHVYAFEPVKKLYDQLNKSVFKNNILNITAFNYGLGNNRSSLPIYSNGSSMAASSLLTVKNKHFIQNIEILKLDDVYEKIGITRVDLMKIDVEGYELEVLRGAISLLKKFQPKIIMEFSPYFYRRIDATISGKIIDLLLSLGYDIFDIDEYSGKHTPVHKLEDVGNKDQTNLLCVRST